MAIVEFTSFGERRFEVTWRTTSSLPPRNQINQARAVCFTPDDQIVMISDDGHLWNIPGGHLEGHETPDTALRREVMEEACCDIRAMRLLAWQRVRDLQDDSIHYELHYCCRVTPKPFAPRHEISHRRLVDPAEFLNTLYWGNTAIAGELIHRAIEANREMSTQGCDTESKSG